MFNILMINLILVIMLSNTRMLHLNKTRIWLVFRFYLNYLIILNLNITIIRHHSFFVKGNIAANHKLRIFYTPKLPQLQNLEGGVVVFFFFLGVKIATLKKLGG